MYEYTRRGALPYYNRTPSTRIAVLRLSRLFLSFKFSPPRELRVNRTHNPHPKIYLYTRHGDVITGGGGGVIRGIDPLRNILNSGRTRTKFGASIFIRSSLWSNFSAKKCVPILTSICTLVHTKRVLKMYR